MAAKNVNGASWGIYTTGILTFLTYIPFTPLELSDFKPKVIVNQFLPSLNSD